MENAFQIAPSILTADFARLGEELEALQEGGADRLHWDIMDGNFVPNLTMGPDIVGSLRKRSGMPFEAHLMVADPHELMSRWVDAGCETLIVHAEAVTHLHRTLGEIRRLGAKAGVALNPATPLQHVEHVLDLVDLLLVMTVNPGFGGQSYISTMEPKIAAAAKIVAAADHYIDLEIDGGISKDTIARGLAAGARTFVVGSALYRDPEGVGHAISDLRERIAESAPEPRWSAVGGHA
ncbi:MAG: ribulose-phosphate 3-epimerase [Acidimicrobiales bacterium]